MEKFCESLTEDAKNVIYFEKEKNNVIANRRSIKIASRFKPMLNLWEMNLKKAL